MSLLGLAWPFYAVDPGGDRMRATVSAIECELRGSSGGVLRYAGDDYAGGNDWVLAALWLGLWHRQIGAREGHRRALGYAQRVARP
jgi:GH15 family glucan-1,4-alpha-glucosidase